MCSSRGYYSWQQFRAAYIPVVGKCIRVYAILYTKYGPPDVLLLQDIEKPSPTDHEVLVRVHAASINALEWRRFTLPTMFVRLLCGGGIRHGADVSGAAAGSVSIAVRKK